MSREHSYSVNARGNGNSGPGTSGFRNYKGDHEISAPGKPPIPASSDPAFRGDKARYNPEELLVASLSACHMLWYLHLCADVGIVVTEYHDDASGAMAETKDGGGQFTQVNLRSVVKVAGQLNTELALRVYRQA